MMIGRAPAQFNDLMRDKVAYEALMECILRVVQAPWDARPIYPGGDEPPARETEFSTHSERQLHFRVDEDAEVLRIFNILCEGQPRQDRLNRSTVLVVETRSGPEMQRH